MIRLGLLGIGVRTYMGEKRLSGAPASLQCTLRTKCIADVTRGPAKSPGPAQGGASRRRVLVFLLLSVDVALVARFTSPVTC